MRPRIKGLGTTAGVGVLVTLVVVIADAVGLLGRLERTLYDERVAHFQFFMPPPTDRLVHLDIDDAALDTQRWPWPRATLARVIEEVARAKPKVIGLDLILSEPQDATWEPQGDGFVRVPQDERLADALGHIGQVLVPASIPADREPLDPFTRVVRDELIENPSLDEAALTAALARRKDVVPARLTEVPTLFITARRDAVLRRIVRELHAAPADEPTVRQRLLPTLAPGRADALTRLIAAQYTRASALIELERHAAPAPLGHPPLRQLTVESVPVQAIGRSATVTGYVDYPQARDERVRSVPLLVCAGDRLYPQFGLAMACATLGVPLSDLRLSADSITLPIPGGLPRVIPTRALGRTDVKFFADATPMGIDIPWFGTSDWASMYNARGERGTAQHLPVSVVRDVCDLEDRIRSNNATADAAIKSLYGAMNDTGTISRFEAEALPADDWRARFTRATGALEDLKPFLPDPAAATQPAIDPAETEKERVFTASYGALCQFAGDAPALEAQLDAQRRLIYDRLHGKSIIFGWVASSVIADFVATPLHNRCPGPVVHGVVFNAIMTGELWRVAPPWATTLATLTAGLLTTLFVVHRAPPAALALTLLLAAIYVVFNGAIVFDWGNVILGAAGPLTAMALVWSGGTLSQLVGEQRQRALIRRRFRTYVDPQLVDFVEKHPKQATFAGERREMTVVFTDLVGFTALTERLGEKTVALLNELWSQVVPVVRRRGYLNKFLGDGVMFFYGAPLANADHARDACEAVLELADVMAAFERDVTGPRGLPRIDMRMGVCTGDMIVGDAGAGAAGSDYTVLGDNVNLGARLEGANKAFGTRNLVTARTVELAGDGFLVRPVAALYVVGRTQAVDVYEVVCRRDRATPTQLARVRLTGEMIDAYRHAQFTECIRAAGELAAESLGDAVAELYKDLATGRLCAADLAPFDPAIILTSK